MTSPLPSPPGGAGLSTRRQLLGAVLALAGLPAVLGPLLLVRDRVSLSEPVLLVTALVVAVALVGGVRPALPAALAGGLLLNALFTRPYGSLAVDRPGPALVLVVYVLVAVSVSLVVDLAARRTREAARARAEALELARLATTSLAEHGSPEAVLERVCAVFGVRAAAVVSRQPGAPAVLVEVETGPVEPGERELVVPVGAGQGLRVRGAALLGEDRRVLASFAASAVAALQARDNARRAAESQQLAEVDRLRTVLLAGLGHDLRTPLAGIKATVSGLRSPGVHWSDEDRDELLAGVEEATDRLSALVTNLLDASRLQVGVLSVDLAPVVLDEAVARAVASLPGRERVEVDVPEDLPPARADLGLLERVLANLLDNALRAADRARVVATAHGAHVEVAVVDHGPGVPAGQEDRLFAPFQRLDERPDQRADGASGLGLGLAVARGFTESMGGTLTPSATAGGGLTMTVRLPAETPVRA